MSFFAILAIILAIAVVAAIIYLIISLTKLNKDPWNTCIGHMKDDGLCCDSSFFTSEFDDVSNYVNSDNIPMDMTDKNNILKFCCGILDCNLRNINIANVLGAVYTYRKALIVPYARMYVYTRDDNLIDVYILFYSVYDYNYMKDHQNLPTTQYPTSDYNTYTYLKTEYESIKDSINNNYPNNVNNLFVITLEDSAVLGMAFRLEHDATNKIQFNFGEVGTFVNTPPNDPDMYTIVGNKDLYKSLYTDGAVGLNAINEPMDPNFICPMDYHRTPYWFSFDIS